MSKGIVLLAAGGTGGHVFPAEALAYKLKERGYSVHLVTDSRAERYAGKFPAEEIHVVPSATIGSEGGLESGVGMSATETTAGKERGGTRSPSFAVTPAACSPC